MKKILLFALLSVFCVGLASAQNTWLKTFGGDEVDRVYEVETDNEGNVYVAGRINADLVIGDTVIKKDGSSSTTVYNYYLIKFNKAGDFVWANMFRVGTSVDPVSGLALDSDHNVYMSLWEPSYFYKFDSTGKQLYEKRINGFGAKIGNIVVDDEDNVWIGGSIYDRTVKVDNLPTIDPGDNKAIMYLVKFDGTGKALLQVPFASNSFTSQISKIAVRDSFLYAIGNTDADIVVGPDTLKDCEMLIAKFNINGEYKWAKSIQGTKPTGFENINDLAISANHQVVVTGRYDDPIFVENITLPNPAEREQMFLISYDNTGNLQWARTSTSYNASGVEIEFTPDNTLAFITSYAFRFTYGGINVGDGVNGKRAAALMETDSLGNPIWIYSLGQTDWNYADALSVDDEGNWYLSGRYTAEPTNTLDGKSVTALEARDLYLLKNFTVPKPNVQNKTFCGGEPNKPIIAIGSGIRWYRDENLTDLVYIGDTLNIQDTVTTDYYVVQKAGGAISDYRKITATLLPATKVALQSVFPALTALPKTGKSYKWFANGVEVSGETSHSIIPTKSGNYHAILIDTNNCNNYSDTVSYTFTSVKEVENNIKLYPNPTSQKVIIAGLPQETIKEIALFSITGKKLKIFDNSSNGLILGDLRDGVYLISIKTANNQYVKQLIIQN